MLVLSRKINEEIIIGEDIKIKVIAAQNGAVKLGFIAPPETMILRGELKEAIAGENLKAQNALECGDLGKISEILKKKTKNDA